MVVIAKDKHSDLKKENYLVTQLNRLYYLVRKKVEAKQVSLTHSHSHEYLGQIKYLKAAYCYTNVI